DRTDQELLPWAFGSHRRYDDRLAASAGYRQQHLFLRQTHVVSPVIRTATGCSSSLARWNAVPILGTSASVARTSHGILQARSVGSVSKATESTSERLSSPASSFVAGG